MASRTRKVHSKRSRRTRRPKQTRRRRKFRKGSKSLTRKGLLDFTTKGTSTLFNRRGHRQSHPLHGCPRRPFTRGGKRHTKRKGRKGRKGRKTRTHRRRR